MADTKNDIANNSQEAAEQAGKHLANAVGHAVAAAVEAGQGHAAAAGKHAAAAAQEGVNAVKSSAEVAGHKSVGN